MAVGDFGVEIWRMFSGSEWFWSFGEVSMRQILASLSGARLTPDVSREQRRRAESFGGFGHGFLDGRFQIRAPNTALEPTRITPTVCREVAGWRMSQFPRGSALDR